MTSVNGGLVLQLQSGTNTIIVSDGSAADANPVAGAITYSGSVGNFTVQTAVGLGEPMLGTTWSPYLDLTSLDTSAAVGGQLVIRLSGDGYSPAPPAGFISAVGGTVGSGGSVSFNVYVNESAVPFLTQGPFSSGAFDDTASATPVFTAPYSLTMEAVIDHPAAASGLATSFGFRLCPVTAIVPPPDRTLECVVEFPAGATTIADFLAQGGLVTTCGCQDVELTYEDVVQGDECSGTITRTYTATDCKGVSLSAVQVITYILADNEPPVIVCAPDKTVDANAPWDFDMPTVTDNCVDPVVTIVSTVTNMVGDCFAATRTWRAEDQCQNASECSQTVTYCIEPPPTGLCPFTLGYWKNHLMAWPDVYTPDQTLDSVFDNLPAEAEQRTFLQALQGHGAPNVHVRNLLKQAVAALLNAASSDTIQYPLTVAEVVEQVNAALDGGSKSELTMLSEYLDRANNGAFCVRPPECDD